jgi:hypothetical protein
MERLVEKPDKREPRTRDSHTSQQPSERRSGGDFATGICALGWRIREGRGESVELVAPRRQHAAAHLDHERAVGCQTRPARSDESAVGVEAVAGGEDCFGRFASEFWVAAGFGVREVGQVGDDQVERARGGVEEVAVKDDDALGEPETCDVGAREQHRGGAGVGGEDFGARERGRERDGDRGRTGADVRDPCRAVADDGDRGVDQRSLAGRGVMT